MGCLDYATKIHDEGPTSTIGVAGSKHMVMGERSPYPEIISSQHLICAVYCTGHSTLLGLHSKSKAFFKKLFSLDIVVQNFLNELCEEVFLKKYLLSSLLVFTGQPFVQTTFSSDCMFTILDTLVSYF